MTIFVMCGGSQKRWDGPGLKQMHEILGEPIVHRTLGQVAGGAPATIVSRPDQYETICDGRDLGFIDSSETDLWAEGFLSTEDAWGEDNVCILGDVWFTDEAARRLLAARGLHVMGRRDPSPYTNGTGETFALTWSAADAPRLKSAMLAAIDHAKSYPAGAGMREGYDVNGCPLGTPWQPYRFLAGFDPTENRTEDEIWIEQNDWTDDVDCYQHAKRLTRRLEAQFG